MRKQYDTIWYNMIMIQKRVRNLESAKRNSFYVSRKYLHVPLLGGYIMIWKTDCAACCAAGWATSCTAENREWILEWASDWSGGVPLGIDADPSAPMRTKFARSCQELKLKLPKPKLPKPKLPKTKTQTAKSQTAKTPRSLKNVCRFMTNRKCPKVLRIRRNLKWGTV